MNIPERMKRFPLWRDRFPLFFTLTVKDGVPDFRVLSRAKQVECVAKNLCHLCGQRMTPPYWFVLLPQELEEHFAGGNGGPMHEECARYACTVCPFLADVNYEGTKPIRATNPTVLRLGQAGKTFGLRPAKIPLVAVVAYRTEFGGQYPLFTFDDYLCVDWDACPQRS